MVYKIPTAGIANSAINTDLLSTDVSNALVPPKGIIMFCGLESEIPTGWYLCDGNNGTPDLRDKFIVGTATIDTNDNNKWKSDIDGTAKSEGGDATKTIGASNLPSHTHTKGTLAVGGGNHTHTYGNQVYDLDHSDRPWGGNNDCRVEDANTGGTGAHTHTVTGSTGNQGGTMGEAFDILPPFFALAFIMRG